MTFTKGAAMQIDSSTNHVKLNPRDPLFYNNPYPYYEKIRAESPIFYWEDFNIWCFLNHADVGAVLRNRKFGTQIDHLGSRESLGLPPIPSEIKEFTDMDANGILGMEPPRHNQIRGLVQKSFMARQIENFKPRIEELSHHLIDQMLQEKSANLLESFATPIPITIIAEMLGVPTTMNSQLLAWSHAMVRMYQLGHTAQDELNAVRATQEFSAYLNTHITQRKANPQDDLITLFIEAHTEGNQLTAEELIANSILLLNAGHEATVNVIGNGIFALLKHPEQLQLLRSEPERIESAVEEILRYDTPLHFFKRWVLEDTEISGKHFPFKSQVAVLLGAANRDPQVFDNPQQFDITRTKNPHVSFGGGIHFCLGAPLARLELQTAIPILLERLPNLRLGQEPGFTNTYHFHGLDSLIVEY